MYTCESLTKVISSQVILVSENVRPFSWESIHRLRVAPPADEERRLYGREEGGVWDSEGMHVQ